MTKINIPPGLFNKSSLLVEISNDKDKYTTRYTITMLVLPIIETGIVLVLKPRVKHGLLVSISAIQERRPNTLRL